MSERELDSKRVGKSLNLLTKRFVALIKRAKDGVLNLKFAAQVLCVRQKRRIYDITNVLEGIGLIEKRSKNSIQWKGTLDSRETFKRVELLTQKHNQLTAEEENLERHIQGMKQSLKNTLCDNNNKYYSYVTRDDLIDCFGDDIILTIKNHDDDSIKLILNNTNNKKIDGLSIKSTTNLIDIRLVTDNSKALVKATTKLKVNNNYLSNDIVVNSNINNNNKRKNDEIVTEEPPVKKRPGRPKKINNCVEKVNQVNNDLTEEDDNLIYIERRLNANILLKKHNQRDFNYELPYEFLTNEVNPPLVKLLPPVESDFLFVLHKNEGLYDLFDIPRPDS